MGEIVLMKQGSETFTKSKDGGWICGRCADGEGDCCSRDPKSLPKSARRVLGLGTLEETLRKRDGFGHGLTPVVRKQDDQAARTSYLTGQLAKLKRGARRG